jgi:hypothetical protein
MDAPFFSICSDPSQILVSFYYVVIPPDLLPYNQAICKLIFWPDPRAPHGHPTGLPVAHDNQPTIREKSND